MPVVLDLFRGAVGALNSRLHCKNNYNNISIRKLDVLPIASAFLSIFLTFSMFLLCLFYHFTQEEYQNHEHIST